MIAAAILVFVLLLVTKMVLLLLAVAAAKQLDPITGGPRPRTTPLSFFKKAG